MKHVKKYENYLAESSQEHLFEKEVMITDDRFVDEKTLQDDIMKNMGPAINKFLKDKGIDYNPITVSANRGRYQWDSKPLTGKDLGIMQYGFAEVYIDSFGGGSLPKISKATAEDGSDFQFPPYIWFNLHYSYKHTSGGSNGCPLILPGEARSDIYYDIVKGEFVGGKEAEARFR